MLGLFGYGEKTKDEKPKQLSYAKKETDRIREKYKSKKITQNTDIKVDEIPIKKLYFDEIAFDIKEMKNEKHAIDISLDFKEKGIGGHQKELEQLIREAFYSRVHGDYSKDYGIKHTKGILLYGPPGTGKTMIAREIGKMFQATVNVVNGPELKNKYVGQSSENLRHVFEAAIRDFKLHGAHSHLHVIIFDEIDALFPHRHGKDSGVNVDDEMVSQLLTLLDGINSPENILVIGITNRKDLIDTALLRPGRLSVHIPINLPNEEARFDILNIKTKTMRQNNLLDKNINFKLLATKTENYTGAELEELVKKASQHAMLKNFEANSSKLELKEQIKNKNDLAKVTMEHFNEALFEIIPAFGISDQLLTFNKDKYLIYSQNLKKIIADFQLSIQTFKEDHALKKLALLIHGESGTGKTHLAQYLAHESGAKNIKTLAINKMLPLSEKKQLQWIDDEFANAKYSKLSVIILEDFENLLLADSQFFSCNNRLRLKFIELLKNDHTTHDNKCIIIATTSNKKFLENLNLLRLFNEIIKINGVKLTHENIKIIAGFLEYKVSFEKTLPQEYPDIQIPFRDFIYQIKKFSTNTKDKKVLNANIFIHYMQENFEFRNILQGLDLHTELSENKLIP